MATAKRRSIATHGDQVVTAVCAYSDFFRFFRSWVADPLRVGAVAPSGDSLSRLITQEIRPSDGPVLELGAGTGTFTRALLARGIRETISRWSNMDRTSCGSCSIGFRGQECCGWRRRNSAITICSPARQLAPWSAACLCCRCRPARSCQFCRGLSATFGLPEASISLPMARVVRCRARYSIGSGSKPLAPSLGRRNSLTSAKARRVLGFSPRPATTTVVDCAESPAQGEWGLGGSV